MKILATFTCDTKETPFRVYINDELMTERIYTIASKKVVGHTLDIDVEEKKLYALRVEALNDAKIEIVKVQVGNKSAFYTEGETTYAYS
jgi:hypothetical protein|tara:strand:- start:475 stop:741 length:267 start_codon:yes stop_codon:yes gene_type:complete